MSLFPKLEAEQRARVAADQRAAEQADADLRKAEADFTPPPVAWSVVDAALDCEMIERGSHVFAYGEFPGVWPAVIVEGRWPAVLSSGVAAGPDVTEDALRVLDLNAGAGVWSMAIARHAAAHGYRVHITAVEYRPEEREHLDRIADVTIIADWHEAFGMVRDERGQWVDGPEPIIYDLVIGNPAFSQARAQIRPEWEADRFDALKGDVERDSCGEVVRDRRGKAKMTAEAEGERRRISAARKALTEAAVAKGLHPDLAKYDPETSMPAVCLRHAPALILYLTSQTWTKTASGFLTRASYPHALAWDIPGSISHRGVNPATGKRWGADDKPYTAFCWLRGHEGPAVVDMLAPLEGRSWAVRPGTEDDAWRRKHGIPTAPGNTARGDGLADT